MKNIYISTLNSEGMPKRKEATIEFINLIQHNSGCEEANENNVMVVDI